MQFRESETVELKRTYVDEIRKEIIAMANGVGGMIYIGINDDGTIEGIENCDTLIQKVTNSVRDSIRPDITMFLHYETQTIEEKNIVKVTVQSGTNKPYYLAAKGLRPAGVFVRQGTSSVPASDAAIRTMIRETDGENYEDMRSLHQTLTFTEAEKSFRAEGMDFGIQQMRSLGIIGLDGLYTNLGLLLSDQCPHIIKAATFGGTDQQDFQDRREFGGSLLKQANEAYEYLNLRNHNYASFNGLHRVDRRDYPAQALREALLNAIVHRDYAFSAGTQLSVYSNHIEFISIGGLVNGITMNDILMGLSICRNKKLANIFYRLKLIEAYGTGLNKIFSAYRDDQRPLVEATENAFRVILPRMTLGKKTSAGSQGKNDRGEKIIQYVHENGNISRQDIEKLLDVKTATAIRTLKELLDEHRIIAVGKGKNTKYTVPDQ